MLVSCAECGTEFDAVRVSARLCSPRCRQKASRRARRENSEERQAKVVALVRPQRRGAEKPKAGEARGALDVEARVRRELGESVDTAMGQACLLVARRLDDRVDASGAAVSSLVGRLEKMLDTIKASTAVAEVKADETNPITFLQQRAVERQRRGA